MITFFDQRIFFLEFAFKKVYLNSIFFILWEEEKPDWRFFMFSFIEIFKIRFIYLFFILWTRN